MSRKYLAKRYLFILFMLIVYQSNGQVSLNLPESEIYTGRDTIVYIYLNEELDNISSGILCVKLGAGMAFIESYRSQFNFKSTELIEDNLKVSLMKFTPGQLTTGNSMPVYSFKINTSVCPEQSIPITILADSSYFLTNNNGTIDTIFVTGETRFQVVCPPRERIQIDTFVCLISIIEDLEIFKDTLIQYSELDSCHCEIDVDLNVKVKPFPEILVEQLILDCIEEASLLSVSIINGYTDNVSIIWDDGIELFERSFFGNGDISFSISYDEGCILDEAISFGTTANSTFYLDSTLLTNGTYLLEVKSDSSLSFQILSWSTGETDRQINVSQGGIYQVEVEDHNGCVYELTIQIDLEDPYSIFIPNAFTPNGDNINDTWNLYCGSAYSKIVHLQIIDRWGNVMFNTSEVAIKSSSSLWDGRMDNSMANPGNYIYYLILEDIAGKTFRFEGSIISL